MQHTRTACLLFICYQNGLSFHIIDGDVLNYAVLNAVGVECTACGIGSPDVAEDEVLEGVEVTLPLTVEITGAFEMSVAEHHIVYT